MNKSSLIKKEDVLRSFVESSRKAFLGFSKEGLEESRELISEMVRFGRITAEQASTLENRLIDQTRRYDQIFSEQVNSIVRDMTPRLEAIASRELADLERRISRLEEGAKPVSAPHSLNV